MRSDEPAVPQPRNGRSGARHAAPRKSLLTKLQIPAGKAMALAAMPTAVFVGMSLTPRLALADDKADMPFAPGPCVTRSDEASQEPSDKASPDASDSASPSAGATPGPSSSPSAKPGSTDAAKPDTAKSGDAKSDDAESGDSGAGDAKDDATSQDTQSPEAKTKSADEGDTATPSPSASETRNPLDPLGLGDALKDLFSPKTSEDKETQEPAGSPSPSASATSQDEEKSGDTKSGSEQKADDAPSGDAAGDKTPGVAGTLKDHISDAARKAGATEKDIEDGARAAGEKNAAGPQADKADPKEQDQALDGTQHYPCPTHDAKALADADVDDSFPVVADQPWRLESTKLSLHGLGYDGIVKVRTASGTVKNVLKFTVTGLDIKDLHQLTVGPDGYTGHVKGAPGSTSTIRDGKVTLYTEELKGNLLGLIPVDFTPDSPPPLTLPELFFTKVTVVQAGQFGGTLHIPGLQNYYDKNAG